MDDRLAALSAVIVGGALTVVGAIEFVLPRTLPEPLATGLFVCGTGIALIVGGAVTARAGNVPRTLVAATAVGVGTLAAAVFSPGSLTFGGVFWLGTVSFALVVAGVVQTVRTVR